MFSKKVTAFIDEFGAYGFNFDNPGCSSHFIIAAVLVKNEDLEPLTIAVEDIRKRYFQTGEMKSSSISKNHKRRRSVLNELKELPFKVFTLVVDKRKIYQENSGLMFKRSFYKFLNELLYKELRYCFSQIDIFADESGSSEYAVSFVNYVKTKQRQTQPSLFDDCHFYLSNSKSSILIQVADVIAGSLAYDYDDTKTKFSDGNSYRDFLGTKIIGTKLFPQSIQDLFDEARIRSHESELDLRVADICNRRVEAFVNENKAKDDDNIRQQIIVIKYLQFRFLNSSFRKYISTKELRNLLEQYGYKHRSVVTFRNKVIAKLRDAGVIIASCSHGYKIPAKIEELHDFVQQYKGILLPMISRLEKCYTTINLGTQGDFDLLENEPQLKGIVRCINKQ